MGNMLHGFNCCANPTTSQTVIPSSPSSRLVSYPHNPTSSPSSEPRPFSGHSVSYPHNPTSSPSSETRLSSILSVAYQLNPTTSEAITTFSSDYSWEEVFLSHSAEQRDFVEQLYIDLTGANISCFFDRHPLSDGQRLNPPSFEAPKTCEVAIVVLSKDYISSTVSMLQLCAFVEAKMFVNSKLKIYPLFYKMSPEEFSQKIEDFDEMDFLGSGCNFQTLRRLRNCLEEQNVLESFEKPSYVRYEYTRDHRYKLLSDVRRLLSPNIRGKERLWQEIANLVKKAPYYKNGVKVIGLYGINGSGKTTLCKSLCDFFSDDFQGKVFHAEFHKGGLPVETLKGLIQILSDANKEPLKFPDANKESVKFFGNYEQALSMLKKQMSSQKVFLCLDNIPDRVKSVKEAQAYLNAGFGEGSLVVLTARSVEILERVIFQEEKRSFVRVPDLSKEEAIDILLNLSEVKENNLTNEEKHIAAVYADLCHFGREGSYHPLALTVLGAYLCNKFGCSPSQWLRKPEIIKDAMQHTAQETIFQIFEQTINAFDPQFLHMLLLLIFYVPNFGFIQNFHHSAFQWLSDVCFDGSNESVRDAIYSMKNSGLIESRGTNSISFHDLLVEFGKSKLEGMEKWWSLEGSYKVRNPTPSIVEVVKFKNYELNDPIPLNQLTNVSVLHMESVWNLPTLNFESMEALISITIVGCDALKEIRGLGSLPELRFLKIEGCESLVVCSDIYGLKKLRHLQMQLPRKIKYKVRLATEACRCLEEIYLDGFREVEFSTRLRRIRAFSINNIDHPIEDLNFTNCKTLQWIKLWNCKGARGLNLTGCSNVRSMYLHMNNNIKKIVGLDELFALEELHLIEMNGVEELPSFQHLGNLRHLTLRNLAKLKKLPDVSKCHRVTTTVDIDRKILCTKNDVSKLKQL